MSTKLLCLANSIKYGGRCVAGLDVETGKWIRPVSERKHGELHDRHCDPNVLDIFRVKLAEHVPEPHQPENWLLADGSWQLLEWELTGRSVRLLEKNLHPGPELFGDCENAIEYGTLEASPVESSLALVNPTAVEFHKPRPDRTPRVLFELAGEEYDLALTDPEWISRVAGKHQSAERYLDDGEEALLTISLGEKYEKTGACHKLVAAVVPVPAEQIE